MLRHEYHGEILQSRLIHLPDFWVNPRPDPAVFIAKSALSGIFRTAGQKGSDQPDPSLIQAGGAEEASSEEASSGQPSGQPKRHRRVSERGVGWLVGWLVKSLLSG